MALVLQYFMYFMAPVLHGAEEERALRGYGDTGRGGNLDVSGSDLAVCTGDAAL